MIDNGTILPSPPPAPAKPGATEPIVATDGFGRYTFRSKADAQLWLGQAQQILKDQELKSESFLALQFRRISTSYEQIRANRAQREAFGEQLLIRKQDVDAGRATLDILLEAQRFWADALNNEYQQIVAYNNALAGFEFAKGTIASPHDVARCGERCRATPTSNAD